MKETIAKLKSAPDLETYQGSVSDAQVSEISSQTGCKLHREYVEFLLAFGFALWDGHVVYGVFDENDSRYPKSYNFSAITQTKEARQLHRNSKYPHYDDSIVIEKDGMGGYFLLVSANDQGASPVVWVDMDEDWVVTKTWDSFESFLEYQLARL
jgi:hypothetical protein